MTTAGHITVSAADAVPVSGPCGDEFAITSLLTVAPAHDGHWVTQGYAGRNSIRLDSDEKALAVAAALVASVELRRRMLAEEAAA